MTSKRRTRRRRLWDWDCRYSLRIEITMICLSNIMLSSLYIHTYPSFNVKLKQISDDVQSPPLTK